MKGRRVWEIGGFIAGGVLILFGSVAIFLGVDGYQTVQDELKKEYIVGGSDMTPEEIQAAVQEADLPEEIELPSCDVVDEEIDTGSELGMGRTVVDRWGATHQKPNTLVIEHVDGDEMFQRMTPLLKTLP